MKKSIKSYIGGKKRSAYKSKGKKKNEPDLTPRQEMAFVRGCVSLILVIAVFLLARANTEKTKDLTYQIKTAISENISLSDAKEYGQKGIDFIQTFKETQSEKIDNVLDESEADNNNEDKNNEDVEEEVYLPKDASLSN